MWNKIMAIFKSGKFCTTVNNLVLGLSSSIVVLNSVKEELTKAKTKSGEKLIPYVEKVVEGLISFQKSLSKISPTFCGNEIIAQSSGLSLEDSLKELERITNELNK